MDSITGIQMAYLKQWSARSGNGADGSGDASPGASGDDPGTGEGNSDPDDNPIAGHVRDAVEGASSR